jgi:hypothetical protein
VLLIDQAEHSGTDETPVLVCVEDKLPGVSLRTLLDAGHRPVGAIAELGERSPASTEGWRSMPSEAPGEYQGAVFGDRDRVLRVGGARAVG